MSTNIEWTEETWNFITGCEIISSGCKFCYAKRDAKNLKRKGNPRYKNGFNFTIHEEKLEEPCYWNKPRQIFVNSMSDLFYPEAPDGLIRQAFETMLEADQHVYQILTKRAQRLADLGPSLPWRDHIWAGVSVENDKPIDSTGYRPTDRIDDLRKSGATVQWISAEPLIGPLPELDLTGIDWVVIGGESGSKDDVRKMDLDWVRDIIAQCRAQGVSVFVKQLGTKWAREKGVYGKGKDEKRKKRKKGGLPSDWPEDLRIREQPKIFDGQPGLG